MATGSTGRRTIPFPQGFMWGTATAAHQVEGHNTHSDWWRYEQDSRLPHASGIACDHYARYADDFALARSLGQNAHRLSLEWSRIEPAPGQWNDDALAHYADVLDRLHALGIEPFVTLQHFTLPDWFQRSGGWLRPDAVECFARYVTRVTLALAGRARHWLTVNEPTVYVKQAYVTGRWPPCTRGSWVRSLRALRAMCRAHTRAYDVLHAARADVRVGFAHSAPLVQPRDPGRLRDRAVAALRNALLNDACFRLLGRAPRQCLDFVGLNYYTRQHVRHAWRGAAMLLGEECRDDTEDGPRQYNSLGWEIYAPGLQATLRRFAAWGLPLYVTENGIATRDEAQRSRFLHAHLRELALAVAGGVDVRGYFYWTLFDNFEWSEGFEPAFGLASVSRPSMERVLRPAAHDYAEVCRSNQVTID